MTYSGAATNGRYDLHTACASAFMGSHLCHAAEYLMANSAVTPPSGGAWLDPSTQTGGASTNIGSPQTGRYVNGYTCQSYTSSSGADFGTVVTEAGGIDTTTCSTARALACCNAPQKTHFAGYTTATTNGSASGRTHLHAMCAAAFAGSHVCHAAEYLRANVPKSPGAGGAWLDPSSLAGASSTNAGVPQAGRYVNGYTCQNYTSSSGADFGTFVTAPGNIDTTDCSTARPVACCL